MALKHHSSEVNHALLMAIYTHHGLTTNSRWVNSQQFSRYAQSCWLAFLGHVIYLLSVGLLLAPSGDFFLYPSLCGLLSESSIYCSPIHSLCPIQLFRFCAPLGTSLNPPLRGTSISVTLRDFYFFWSSNWFALIDPVDYRSYFAPPWARPLPAPPWPFESGSSKIISESSQLVLVSPLASPLPAPLGSSETWTSHWGYHSLGSLRYLSLIHTLECFRGLALCSTHSTWTKRAYLFTYTISPRDEVSTSLSNGPLYRLVVQWSALLPPRTFLS